MMNDEKNVKENHTKKIHILRAVLEAESLHDLSTRPVSGPV